MRVRILRSCWIDGKNAAPKKELEVDDVLGRQLIGAGQAELAPEKPKATRSSAASKD